ncbi:glycosyltransferase 87 family protein [Streptomyces sp. NPDC006798]|uniref:glycosyltransferase 87 family protein n=1 Tax=Streptomyces sp. NPDC006798 TaxID=3155462 RepID=UPI0033CFFB89
MSPHRISPSLPPVRVRIPGPSGPPGGPSGLRRRTGPALAAAWLLTRAVMLVLLAVDRLGDTGVAGEVGLLYRGWYDQWLARGSFPAGDVTWQYPPGAGLVLLAPGAVPFLSYFHAFVALVLLCDAVITLALARAARTGRTASGTGPDAVGGTDGGTGSAAGAWLWVAGLPLLLNLPLARYDVPVTAVAVLALLALRRRPLAGGALAGLGAMIKVWPVLTLLGTPRGRTTKEAWGAAAAAAAGLLAVLVLLFDGALGFLRQQGARGVQIESLGGTVLQLAHRAGWDGRVVYQYGAMEFTGPYVPSVARLALALTAAAFCWLLFWRLRARRWTPATPFDAAFTAVLLFTVTSRVISPQYLVWLLGLAAVCLACRETVLRPAALLMAPAAAVSALAYPLNYDEVIGATVPGCALMVVRNGLLLAAAVLACRRLWRSTV